jgi:hypothetical protein
MRCSSSSTARPTICGRLLTRTAPCWTSWSPPGGTPRLPSGSSASCSRGCGSAAGAGHRQAGQLRCGPPTADTQGAAPSIEVPEPGRELPPTRARERAMKRFTSSGHAQRFLFAFSGISPHFRSRRHRLTAAEYRHEVNTRFTTWNQVTGLARQPPDHSNRIPTQKLPRTPSSANNLMTVPPPPLTAVPNPRKPSTVFP